MKSITFFFFLCSLAAAVAQHATPSSTGKPFEGFGGTSLDQRPPKAKMAAATPAFSHLASGTSALNFEAKTRASGGGTNVGATTVGGTAGLPTTSSTDTRESHPVLELKVRNMANQPENARFDWFFLASDVRSGFKSVWDQGERDVTVPARGELTQSIEAKSITQQTTKQPFTTATRVTSGNTTYNSTQTTGGMFQTGKRPYVWIVRMFVDGKLVKVQASSPPLELIGHDPAQLTKLQR